MALVVVFGLLPRWMAEPVVTTDVRPRPQPQVGAATAVETPVPLPSPRVATASSQAVAPVPAEPTPTPADDPWSIAVTEGLAALERGAFDAARAAFLRAEAARPGTAAVVDGLARAEAGSRALALTEHRQRAEAAEAQERWRAAVGEYDMALRLEPQAGFALEGRTQAALRAELDERLEGYLGHPERLSAEAVANEAGAAAATTAEIRPQGPRLARQVAALQELLVAARTPVAVRLVSDGRTEVSVLRFGRLGLFKEKALDLRPGSYVVVGTRPGYRDARRTLVVPPGRSPEPLVVRCEEPL
jgi:hypothetical protein